jgi:hypothetical protein
VAKKDGMKTLNERESALAHFCLTISAFCREHLERAMLPTTVKLSCHKKYNVSESIFLMDSHRLALAKKQTAKEEEEEEDEKQQTRSCRRRAK